MRDNENNTVSTQLVHEATAKRQRLLSHIDDEETLSRRPSPVLPDDLIFDILMRLSVRSLLRLRCVCKSWKTLISDPQFAKDHLRHSITYPSMTRHQLVPCIVTKPWKIVKQLFGEPSTPDKAVSGGTMRSYRILGSCNGLLCVHNVSKGYVRLYNPSTRLRSKRSPTAVLRADGVDGIVRYHGFGYDQVNDKYKVVLGAAGDIYGKTVTEVYTFGANSWTTIQNSPFLVATGRRLGKFVSGTLNWVTKGGVSSDQWVILSFDLVKESYGQVLLPQQDGCCICSPVLDVLSNCLCVCFKSNKTHWVVWLMKEYGVAESWTKLMMIPSEKFRYSWLPSFENFCIWESGGVLVKNLYSKLVLYDAKDGRFHYPWFWRELWYDLHIYHESLVSPLW